MALGLAVGPFLLRHGPAQEGLVTRAEPEGGGQDDLPGARAAGLEGRALVGPFGRIEGPRRSALPPVSAPARAGRTAAAGMLDPGKAVGHLDFVAAGVHEGRAPAHGARHSVEGLEARQAAAGGGFHEAVHSGPGFCHKEVAGRIFLDRDAIKEAGVDHDAPDALVGHDDIGPASQDEAGNAARGGRGEQGEEVGPGRGRDEGVGGGRLS